MRIGKRWPTFGRVGGYALAFVVLTAIMTWPLLPNAGSSVQDLGDPLYEMWTMRWAQHQIVNDPGDLWNGNTAYPFRLSFLFSESRLSTSLLAWPLQIVTGNDVLVYNLMFLTTFVLLGLGMALLVSELTGSAGAGLLAGIFAAFTPYRYGHLSHLNLLSYCWLPLALWALVRYGREPRPRHALRAALFLTIQLLASDTIALMTLAMIALAVPFVVVRHKVRSRGHRHPADLPHPRDGNDGAVGVARPGLKTPGYMAKPTEGAGFPNITAMHVDPSPLSGLRHTARGLNPAQAVHEKDAPRHGPGTDAGLDRPDAGPPEDAPRGWLFYGGLAGALAVPIAAFTPLVLGRLEVTRVYGFTRDLATIRDMSATLAHYVSVAPGNHFWEDTLPVAYPNPLFPGAVALAGALLALLLTPWRRSRWVLFSVLIALGGLILSLGPETEIGGRVIALPYSWLYEHVPGFNSMRDVARFGMLAILGVQILAGLGLAAAWTLLRPRLPARSARLIGVLLVAMLSIASLVEYRSPVGAVEVPRDPSIVAVYDWLAEQPSGPVYELPGNGLWANLGQTIGQIYHSTRHWQPIVAGYTSFLPERYIDLLTGINGGIHRPSRIDATNVGVLQDLGIRYLLVHHRVSRDYDWRRAVALADQLPELERVGDIGAATAYLVEPGQREPVRYEMLAPEAATSGVAFPITFRIANGNRYDALTTLDPPPPVTATWTDARGDEVLRTTMPVDIPVVVRGGDTLQILWATPPPEPGRYRLRLTLGDLTPPVETTVEVRAPRPIWMGEPPVALRSLDGPDGRVRAGETIELTTLWDVLRPPALDYTFTAQLLDRERRVVAQWDGQPFNGELPTTRWLPGMQVALPLSLQVPETVRPGRYTLMIALYDDRTPQQRRIEIILPDGTTKPEFMDRTVVVTAS